MKMKKIIAIFSLFLIVVSYGTRSLALETEYKISELVVPQRLSAEELAGTWETKIINLLITYLIGENGKYRKVVRNTENKEEYSIEQGTITMEGSKINFSGAIVQSTNPKIKVGQKLNYSKTIINKTTLGEAPDDEYPLRKISNFTVF
jgi:hypothetical protein